MTSTIAAPISQIELTPDSAMLIGMSWDSYLALLQELGDNRSTRLAYEDGILEIRMPGQPHEAINRVLATIALTLAEAFGLEFNDLGSFTLNHPDLSKGVEPDSCFYIQNAQPGQGLGEPIASELPPDLALEVDIANRSDSKLSIYLAMGVPEIWLYRHRGSSAGRVQIKHLHSNSQNPDSREYRDALTSLAFPTVTADLLNQWLELRRTGTDLTVVRAVRQFCRS